MPSLTRIAAVAAAAAVLAGCSVETDPTPVQPPEGSPSQSGKPAAAKKKVVPIKLSARRATAKRTILSDGGALSCVRVTVTNQSTKNLDLNPLYFSLTDTNHTKHDVSEAIADYEGQIPTTTLAPGENAKGVVCATGKFTPKIIAMTNPLFAETARAAVS